MKTYTILKALIIVYLKVWMPFRSAVRTWNLRICVKSVQDTSFGTPVKNTRLPSSLTQQKAQHVWGRQLDVPWAPCALIVLSSQMQRPSRTHSRAPLSLVVVKITARYKIIPSVLLCYLCGVGAGRSRFPGKDERQNFGGWKEWQ